MSDEEGAQGRQPESRSGQNPPSPPPGPEPPANAPQYPGGYSQYPEQTWAYPGQAPSPMYQGQPQQYPAMTPYGAPQQRDDKGFGITGLVTGIVGLALSWVPILNMVLGVVATTFGGLALHKVQKGTARNRGFAIAGLTMGIITIGIAILFLVVAVVSPTSE